MNNKKLIVNAIANIGKLNVELSELSNDDYNYRSDIQELMSLADSLLCRYSNYKENDEQ